MKLDGSIAVTRSTPSTSSDTRVAAPSTAAGRVQVGHSGASGFEAGGSHGIWAGPDGRGCLPLPPFFPERGVTVSKEDHANARGLKDALTDPMNALDAALDPDSEKVNLRRGPDGRVQGPNGEPLVAVKLGDGKTAYVDPNTNQYYLAQRSPFGGRGSVAAVGPIDLPEEAQFSNSHFSEADARSLERDANSPFIGRPLQFPFPRPQPAPRWPELPTPLPQPAPRWPELPLPRIPFDLLK